MPTLSIVIPVYNGAATLTRCLAALVGQPADEVIVVDDGSTDSTPDILLRFPVRVIRTSAPGGPARARNLGAAAAHGDILIFLDADVEAHPDALQRIASAFAERPHLHAVIGSYDDAPADRSAVSTYKNLLHHYVHQQAQQQTTTFWGGCGVVRRETYLRLGGMNEAYTRPCIEDIEFGYRLYRAGLPCELRKDIQSKHLKRWTLSSLIRSDFLDRAIPWTELMLRTKMFPADLNFSYGQKANTVLSLTCATALLLSPLQPAAALPAAAAGILYLGLNLDLYRLLARRGGPRVLLTGIPLNFLYSVYCALGFIVGLSRHTIRTAMGKPVAFRSSLSAQPEGTIPGWSGNPPCGR